MADDGSTPTTERREGPRDARPRRRPRRPRSPRSRDGEKGGALALSGAVIAWSVAVIHLVNGFTRPIGLVDVRVIDASRLSSVAHEQADVMVTTVVHGTAIPWTDVSLHRPLDKIDLILFFALAGTACLLAYRLARQGSRGARDVLDGTATARWLGIVLVALGVVPPLVQAQATLVRLADAGVADVLAPAHPVLGWGWIAAGIGVALVVPALRKATRRGRD